ncbi:integrase catalytic domain-containing protein [Trichonephila clavipes]|nr:integrase catalytic domain-containing protein [Trichonephila clavipes]
MVLIREENLPPCKWLLGRVVKIYMGKDKKVRVVDIKTGKDNLRIPRLVLDSTNDEVSDLIEIHIFCDASKLAYGAAAYVKVRKQNEVLVNLIASKTRVASLKATLNRVAISSDIRQAFLQICLADKHKDFVRFLWTDSNPRIGEKLTLQVYRFNRVIFGVNSSPFLLAATIKYHIEKYNEIHPITVQHLDSFMYVDDWITGQDTREEALFMSRHAKNIMKEAGMEMRKWISNDTVLMAQWAAEGFDTHPMDASIRLGTNKTKVLGMAWQTLDDCLTLDTKGLLEFVSINEYTKDLCYKQ